MPHTLHHPSAPPARLTDAVAALQLVDLAISRPLRSETVVFLADDSHLGHTCFIVSGTSAVDDVLDVAALVVEVAERSPAVHAVVLATSVPPHPSPRGGATSTAGSSCSSCSRQPASSCSTGSSSAPTVPSSLREGTGLPLLWRGGADGGSACRASPALRRRQPQAGGPQPP